MTCSTSGSGRRWAFAGDGTRHAADSDTAAPYAPAIVEQLLAGVHPVDDPELRRQHPLVQRHARRYLFLLYFDTRVGHGDTGPYPLPDGKVLLVPRLLRDGPERLSVELGREGRALSEPHRGVGPRRRDDRSPHGLRHELHDARGLPRAPRRFRPVHHRRDAARRAPRRGARRDGAASSLRCARRSRPSTATSPGCLATRRSEPARTCTSRSCARSPPRPASSTSSTGPCPRDIPPPLYDMVSLMEGDNAATTDEGPYYSPLP